MWFYLEFALFVLGFLLAYRAGWKSGWHAAFKTIRKAVNVAQRLQKLEDLNPKKSEKHPFSEEQK
jgi:hypothetical protein